MNILKGKTRNKLVLLVFITFRSFGKPFKLFHNELKNVKFLGIICDDIKLSKKIDCQHFSSWNYNSLKFLSKKLVSVFMLSH